MSNHGVKLICSWATILYVLLVHLPPGTDRTNGISKQGHHRHTCNNGDEWIAAKKPKEPALSPPGFHFGSVFCFPVCAAGYCVTGTVFNAYALPRTASIPDTTIGHASRARIVGKVLLCKVNDGAVVLGFVGSLDAYWSGSPFPVRVRKLRV